MTKKLSTFIVCLFASAPAFAQHISLQTSNLTASETTMESIKVNSETVVRIKMDTSVKLFDQPTFVKINSVKSFKDGVIELKVLSKFLPGAPEWARGFIGVAFRVSEDNKKFESIYLRPDNGQSTDQIRRNHSTQYFSFPDYSFDRMRKEFPERYESYVDIEMNKWISIRIVVKGQTAKLYVDRADRPCLVVNDLKLGQDLSGGIGLWVGPGTDGYFEDLKISD